MTVSRSMRMAPRTDCSASRLWGGSRSITAYYCSGAGWGPLSSVAGPPVRSTKRDDPWPAHPRLRTAGGADVDNRRGYPRASASAWSARRGQPALAAPLVELADDADQLPLDPHVVVELRGI